MRLRHPDGSLLHLAYCTNVHPAEDLDGVGHQLATTSARVRELLDVPRLGVGLWLAADALGELAAAPHRVGELRELLDRNGLEVVTLNGFPYGGFHDPVVKHAVYRPDWAEAARIDYTIGLAHVLVQLLPDDVEVGTISTLPIGWATWVDDERRRAAHGGLERLADALDHLRDTTGRTVRVGLEHEPGCVAERADEVIAEVRAIGAPGIAASLDACHLAVEFEDPAEVAAQLRAHDPGPGAHPPAVKLQVASALRVGADELEHRHELLERYVEPRFLHQTRERGPDGVIGVDDLDQALDGGLPGEHEWRVHVHVPVHATQGTTQDVLHETLREVVGGPRALTHHLEVETYTWTVLPPESRPTTPDELAQGLAHELAWTRDRLIELGCKEAN